ncbi:MAG: sigma 54-interacting transcriptional regulator, partial [bacterium]
YLLYNDESYLKPASAILEYCRHNFPSMEVHYQPALAVNPTEYNTIYPAMYQAVKAIIEENPDAEFTISVTSGTPTMHACWIFLQQGGVIDAKLVQIHRETGLSEINFNLDDFPKIQSVSETKVALTKLARENKLLRHQISTSLDAICGESAVIREVKEQIRLFSNSDLPIFISGESGTGKELVAEALHYASERCEKPIVKVNCGAISSQLFESEFFGHKRGSFTGAISDKDGKFELADKGTIFLDEIGDLPLEMQVKLLRFLDQGTIQVVGGKEEKVDVRLISATNKDLRQLFKDRQFREDLFYRLVQTEIHLPPLRERGNDKILIAQNLITTLNHTQDKRKYLTESALDKIRNYHWPGNVRQLKSALSAAFVYPEKEITDEHLHIIELTDVQSGIVIPPDGIDLDSELIPEYYRAALRQANGNAAFAAQLLNIPPATFRARLRKLGIKTS